MKTTYYSNGKLLISGEYLVLDGATALAIPTKFGQNLTVEPIDGNTILWKSYNNDASLWLQAKFVIEDDGSLKSLSAEPLDSPTKTLLKILNSCLSLNPTFLSGEDGFNVTSNLDFPNNWGLGSSSTLINNVAQWAEVDAFDLLHKSFGGSGYDIACAQNDVAILYSLDSQKQAIIKPIELLWPFKDQLFFVHLGNKMDSKKGIAHYTKNAKPKENSLKLVSQISERLMAVNTIQSFEALLREHEQLLSQILGITTIKEQLFKEYPRAIKSLGAWGGDFVLAVGTESQMDFFRKKGYATILTYDQMILP